jgi:integrase
LLTYQRDRTLDALRECLKAYRKARRDAHLRDLGEIIETPTAPKLGTNGVAKGPQFLRDVLPAWTASKTRKPDTVRAVKRSLEHYEKATGNPRFSELTRAKGVEFRAYLLGLGVSSKTAHSHLDNAKTLLNFAVRDLELLPRNPWSGLNIEYTTENPRAPWSQEQLAKLCALPLFTSYALPKRAKAGQDASYWIPLLGMFTGARVGELGQLRVQDVQRVDGVPVLRITDEAEGASIKTAAGHRMVPVHAELQRLGFLEYVAAVKDRGAVSLWPALPVLPGKPGHYASAAFTPLRGAGDDKLPDFHSLRHTVRSKLASARIDRGMIDALMGHEVKGSEGDRTYTHWTTHDKAQALESLRYPGLSLPRVYKVPLNRLG